MARVQAIARVDDGTAFILTRRAARADRWIPVEDAERAVGEGAPAPVVELPPVTYVAPDPWAVWWPEDVGPVLGPVDRRVDVALARGKSA